jgi:YD repeat-containing protein
VLGSGALSFSWDVLMQYGLQWMCDWAAPYSPPGYIYTDAVGTQYAMGADGSLQSITDLSGNSLTVTAAGITSSPSGVSVPFVRDGQGRITQITDTLGRNYLYGYDANGNLATVTFPGIATPAKYQYDATHLVTAEIDRRGTRTPALTTPTAGCNRSRTRRATPRSGPTTRPRKPPP